VNLLDIVKEEQRRRAAGQSPLSLRAPPPPSFAKRTGQAWRFRLTQSISILGFLTIVAGWWTIKGPHGAALILVGTLLGGVGFVGQCLSVRCPRCAVAVVWHTFNTRRVAEAQVAAQYQLVCPKCGYDPP
jgi:predicted RNA-binding Zn-ribbon protein involved in translation (DUF1610 family)